MLQPWKAYVVAAILAILFFLTCRCRILHWFMSYKQLEKFVFSASKTNQSLLLLLLTVRSVNQWHELTEGTTHMAYLSRWSDLSLFEWFQTKSNNNESTPHFQLQLLSSWCRSIIRSTAGLRIDIVYRILRQGWRYHWLCCSRNFGSLTVP